MVRGISVVILLSDDSVGKNLAYGVLCKDEIDGISAGSLCVGIYFFSNSAVQRGLSF